MNVSWVSVEERLPDDCTRVVAAHIYESLEGGDPDAFVSWFCNGKFNVDTDGLDAYSLSGDCHAEILSNTRVTHWFYLPPFVKPFKQEIV